MAVEVGDMLKRAIGEDVSDIFITSGTPVMFKRDGVIAPIDDRRVMPDTARQIIEQIFAMAPGQDFGVNIEVVRTKLYFGDGERRVFSMTVTREAVE